MDPDDTLPPSGALHDTLPAPPMLDEPEHEPFCIVRPVTLFPSALQALPANESGEHPSIGKRFDAAAFASDVLDEE